MIVLKKTYDDLMDKYAELESHSSWLTSAVNKTAMKFKVIAKLMDQASKGMLTKRRLVAQIMELIAEDIKDPS